MTEPTPSSTPAPTVLPPPVASIKRKPRFELIWLIPIVAGLIAGYLGIRTLTTLGPEITLTFRSADGLKAGQTKVRHKAVDLGTVQAIKLSDDLTHVIVTVQMQREATAQMTTNARFWVVRPRLNAGSISGLDTLLSGAYIEIDPGAPDDTTSEAKRDFVGLDEPPAVRSDEPGLSYVLRAGSIAGISSGSPVLYRDITVGEVLRWELNPDGQGFVVYIFVRKPFDRFVREGTHFWNASGVSVEVGANGVRLRLDSLQALVSGAVAFDTAREARDSPLSPQGSEFRLYRDQSIADAAGYKKRIPFITSFDSSVRGLAVGAPVEFYGIELGSVTGIKLLLDPAGTDSRVDVRFELQPERILSAMQIDGQDPLMTTRNLVKRGLRIQLHTANYLTGQMVLGMDFVPDARPQDAQQLPDGTLFVPSQAGGLDGITSSVAALANKLNHIPFEQISADLQQTLHGVSTLANGPELRDSLVGVQITLATIRALVTKFDAGSAPLLKRLPEMAQSLQATLDRTSKLVSSADTGYGADSQVRRDLERLMAQLTDTARSVRLLADYLNQHPDALIQGRSGKATER